MEVKILGQSIFFNNQSTSAQKIIEVINQLIRDSGLFLSCLKVNGKDIYNDFEFYIEEHLNTIQVIEVEVKNRKEWLDDMLLSGARYLERSIPAVQQLADRFYQGPSAGTWTQFAQLLEGVEWLVQLIHGMEQNKLLYPGWGTNITVAASFKEALDNLAEAMENSDTILIADIINYEIMPLLESLMVDVQKTIDSEVKRNDLN
ncbi:hypothetical protein [Desulfoscipio geothermicus]|uniref:DUF8042 domain-containing protein n=1 Tax=Desulfoscipio geothermicus DSM 3669 TaxID=1121426 RepID=A0A1I6CUN2_9FIRM|nr:hypothetical protein [Desulfoscipio geothermicus]SFQ96882.1 hypothetical protein SAMN05660706_10277 [Desulfoscipio geothermicus DSM 3669]